MGLGKTLLVLLVWIVLYPHGGQSMESSLSLPGPDTKGRKSLEEALKSRRTVRDFRSDSLTPEQLAQLLWAADGISEERGFKRTAPSAGALYPIDVYILIGKNGVSGWNPGVYRYHPEGHKLSKVRSGDFRREMASASLGQMWMARAPVTFLITGDYERCARKYRERGVPYTYIEAGHIGQNLFLQAEALGLGAGIVGAFDNRRVIEAAGIPARHDPILLLPVGYKAD